MKKLADEVTAEIRDRLLEFSRLFRSIRHATKTKKLVGPTFGAGDYELCSYVSQPEGGLHEVVYFVVHSGSGIPIAAGGTKAAAIHDAAYAICTGALSQPIASAALAMQREAEAARKAAKAAADAAILVAKGKAGKRQIPRRRKAVFEASKGACHYCGTSLEIEVKWHIEHKMPRALMGGNEPSNLVASCVSCNMKKRDKTDVEFFAEIDKASSAA